MNVIEMMMVQFSRSGTRFRKEWTTLTCHCDLPPEERTSAALVSRLYRIISMI